jgi:hypothetical protein
MRGHFVCLVRLLRQLDLYYQLILLGLLDQSFQLSLCFL